MNSEIGIMDGVARQVGGAAGCAFYSETCIGMKVPVPGFLFSWLILPFIYSRKQGKQRNNFNIEERAYGGYPPGPLCARA